MYARKMTFAHTNDRSDDKVIPQRNRTDNTLQNFVMFLNVNTSFISHTYLFLKDRSSWYVVHGRRQQLVFWQFIFLDKMVY